MTETFEGIVLHTLPYQENSLIGSVLTKEGVLSFISNKNKKNAGIISPLCLGSFELTKKPSSTLYKIKSFHISNQFLGIRKSYAHLQSAFQILKTLKDSQLAETPSPHLFNLTKCYLEKLGEFENPCVLKTSFFIKFLNHEGCLRFNLQCSHCNQNSISKISMGDFFCSSCFTPQAIEFSPEELKIFFTLGLSRSFSELKKIQLDTTTEEKINGMYNELTS